MDCLLKKGVLSKNNRKRPGTQEIPKRKTFRHLVRPF